MKQKERFKLVSAVHLFLIKENKILLLRRFNTGYEDGNYGVIAGHLDGGETATKAMIREAFEEAGIQIQSENLKQIHVMHRNSQEERVDFFFVASTWSGELKNTEPNKCDDLSWFPLSELPDNMVPYVKEAINNFQKGIYFSEFGWE